MNSKQLAERLSRNLDVDDHMNLPADAGLDVLQAMNAGLAQLYRNLPGIYKRTVLSHHIEAPQTVTVQFQSRFSSLMVGTPFTADMIGKTIRFSNADSDSVIVATNQVLDDYIGNTLSPIQATVYSDLFPMQDVIERIVGAIRCYDNSQSQPTILIRDEHLRGGRAMWWNWPWDQWGDSWYPLDGWLFGSVGRPRYFYQESFGSSQGAQPPFSLRLVPFPDIDYTLRAEAELYTQVIKFPDLTNARPIYVQDALVFDMLIPLCEKELTTSPFWAADPDKTKRIEDRGQEVLDKKIGKVPTDVTPAANLIGTPRGY